MKPVSLGRLPIFNKEQSKILLQDLNNSNIKLNTYINCKEKLQKIIKKEGL